MINPKIVNKNHLQRRLRRTPHGILLPLSSVNRLLATHGHPRPQAMFHSSISLIGIADSQHRMINVIVGILLSLQGATLDTTRSLSSSVRFLLSGLWM